MTKKKTFTQIYFLKKSLLVTLALLFLTACTNDLEGEEVIDFETQYPQFFAAFADTIDWNNASAYSNQAVPFYITKDNTAGNNITNSGALLGRILFYDKNLSSDNSVSCASCHVQAHAFGDTNDVSTGVNGVTGRHSTRLINTRFGEEDSFFWDERASTLEDQTTQPIQDHNEMGFSGLSGAPDMNDLIDKLNAIDYYQDLFTYAFGSSDVTEARIQLALAQFLRSIQSFDSAYDTGRLQVSSDFDTFPNFNADQNAGKLLFMNSHNDGGANCATCHKPPEFDIDRNSQNNGVIGVFGSVATDTTITRSPSLRDMVKADGSSNGAFMHDASAATLEDVVDVYDNGLVDNADLDNRLQQGGSPQNLNLTTTEKTQLVEFLKTLSGNDVYTNEKWSDPFN